MLNPKVPLRRNYLRVRGEYSNAESKGTTSAELPPRARRILTPTIISAHGGGTTSACAENTLGLELGDFFIRNYLRVRGEYGSLAFRHDAVGELPPRARRIPPMVRNDRGKNGTTSACAENTPHGTQPKWTGRNYLRVRGEYWA